tara:strand:- start:77 stop:271 length:195 start_codon:yes stop_codon:yes gene_type:complete
MRGGDGMSFLTDLHFKTLKEIEIGLKVAIEAHIADGAPKVIVDELTEAMNHISKAMDILDWDDL